MAEEGTAGDVYADVIDGLLQFERERKTSLEQKALGVITSSGVLVTLLFGFASLSAGKGAGPIPTPSRWLLVAALVAFVVATVASLRINSPVDYQPLGVKRDLRRMVTDEFWLESAPTGRRMIAEFRVGEIDRWRDSNGAKARRLRWAILAESSGVAVLAVAVAVLLLTR